MNNDKSYREYIKQALLKSDAILLTLEQEYGIHHERYKRAKEYNVYLRIHIKKPMLRRVDNSIPLPREVEGKL